MAGRKPLDKDEVTRRALAATRAVIAARGLQAVTAREIAASSGCSVGSLYNVFGSLDELVLALNAQTLDRLHEAMRRVGGQGDSAVERMVTLADAYIDFAGQEPLVWRAVFDHQPASGSAKPAWYLAKIEAIADLAIAIMAPLFGPEQRAAARDTATILWSGVHGICALAQGGNLRTVTASDPRRMAAALVRTYLAGLAAIRDKAL